MATTLQDPAGPERRFPMGACAGVALCLVLAGAAALWQRKLQAQDVALHAQLSVLEARWHSASAQLHEATDARPQLLALLNRQKHLVQERSAPGWAPALRSVLAAAEGDIELLDIRAREKLKEPGVGELQISGVVIGDAPRNGAERFRAALEAKLGKDLMANAVLTEFAPFDAAPDAPRHGIASRKAAFTVVAAVGLASQVARGPGDF